MLLQKPPQYLWLIVAKSRKNHPSLAPRHKTHSSVIWRSFYFNSGSDLINRRFKAACLFNYYVSDWSAKLFAT